MMGILTCRHSSFHQLAGRPTNVRMSMRAQTSLHLLIFLPFVTPFAGANECAGVMADSFADVGSLSDNLLIKESSNEFVLYGTGR
jgi:hypothetical protein